MRLTPTFLLTIISLAVYGQQVRLPINYSPDKNFGLLVTIGGKESFPEWSYYLITNNNDTILLTTSMTHDEKPSVTYWSKSSRILIVEEQSEGDQREESIRLYNLIDKKVEFEVKGFIWGEGKNNFDQDRGLLFYFKRVENKSGAFDLLSLDIETKEIKKLSTVLASGDPLTGMPEIGSIDTEKKQLILTFETIGFQIDNRKIDY